jgi:hypothetical protein
MNSFITIIKKTGLEEEVNFGTRDIGGHYNLAVQTQVDEVYSRRHMEMSPLEFKEALGRVADTAI